MIGIGKTANGPTVCHSIEIELTEKTDLQQPENRLRNGGNDDDTHENGKLATGNHLRQKKGSNQWQSRQNRNHGRIRYKTGRTPYIQRHLDSQEPLHVNIPSWQIDP